MARHWKLASSIAVAGLAGLLAVGPMASIAFGDAISDRKQNRKDTAEQMKAMKAIVDANGPAAGVVAPAKKVVDLEATFVKDFPAGSDKGDTKALPVVWSDWKGFETASHNLTAQATKMAELGQAGNMDAVKAQFAEMGKACGGCHNTYRAK
jgi:cytochrome c556